MSVPISNYQNLAFSTQFRYEHLPTNGKGSVAFSVGAFGIVTWSIAHNLGYKPYVRAFYKYTGDSRYWQLYAGPGSYGLVNGGQIDSFYADTSNLYIAVSENNGSPITGTIYYRIYAEPQV